jgi:hypothetical protein
MVPLGHKCPVSDNDAQRLWAPSLAKAGCNPEHVSANQSNRSMTVL